MTFLLVILLVRAKTTTYGISFIYDGNVNPFQGISSSNHTSLTLLKQQHESHRAKVVDNVLCHESQLQYINIYFLRQVSGRTNEGKGKKKKQDNNPGKAVSQAVSGRQQLNEMK